MKTNKTLNIDRLELIQKGYINQKELAIFLDVGKKRARAVYENICSEIIRSGRTIDVLGIPTSRVLEYIGLTEKDVRRFANDEREQVINYDS